MSPKVNGKIPVANSMLARQPAATWSTVAPPSNPEIRAVIASRHFDSSTGR